MVADGGLERTRGHWMTGCPPIIHRLYASHAPSGSAASLLLSDYRDVPAILTAQPGRRHRQRPARSAALSLSHNRARSLRPGRHSDRSFLRYALAPALGNARRRLTVASAGLKRPPLRR